MSQNNSVLKYSVLNNLLNQLDEILYQGLQPWNEANESIEKFESLVPKVASVKSNFNSLYEFDFHRPQNAKAHYYYKLIVNRTNEYCNNIVALINEDNNALRQQYWYDDTIKDQLPKRLTDCIEAIKEHHFFIEYIDPKKLNFDVNTEHKTNSYIIQVLKVAFIKMYLEIQAKFKHLSKELLLSEGDIYDQFLNQALPQNSFLKRNKNIEDETAAPHPQEKPSPKPEGISRSSFTYKKYNEASDKLSDVFKFLKENTFIAKENPLANFKRVFSGNEVSNQVIWTGTSDDLYYFIDLVHNKFELVEPIKRRIWTVACKCFLKADGTQFNPLKLKAATKPEGNAELLEKAVNMLK